LKCDYSHVLDVRTSAHLNWLLAKSLLTNRHYWTDQWSLYICICVWVTKVTKIHNKREADYTSSTLSPKAVSLVSWYVEVRPSKRNLTAHISLQILSISKSQRQKITEAPSTFRRARRSMSLFSSLYL